MHGIAAISINPLHLSHGHPTTDAGVSQQCRRAAEIVRIKRDYEGRIHGFRFRMEGVALRTSHTNCQDPKDSDAQ